MSKTSETATQAGGATIRDLPRGDRTVTPQIHDELFDLRARTTQLRQDSATAAGAAEDIHDRVQTLDLNERASALVQNDLADLLVMLGEDRGMPWSLVADLVGVSATAVRKWRRGGEITPDRRARLARLVAFCQIVADRDSGFPDVSLWLQTPIIAGATALTPADLFAETHEIEALNLAGRVKSAEEVLDRVRADWRTSTRPDNHHRVVEAPDGVLSIVPVTDPEH
ncbi:MAG: hypothetical protein WKF96_12465 [Solirubrobacteraceae bacterium]